MIVSITKDGNRFFQTDKFAVLRPDGRVPLFLLDWNFSSDPKSYYEEKVVTIAGEKFTFVGYFSYDKDVKMIDSIDIFNGGYEKIANIVDIFVPVGKKPVDYKNDQFYLSSAHDYVEDGGGDDYVDLGSGNDVYVYRFGTDKVYGGEGFDRVEAPSLSTDKLAVKAIGDDWFEFRKDGELVLSTKYVERVTIGTDTVALDVSGSVGQVYRLYQAAFDRTPDKAGLGYWIRALDAGKVDIHEVAKAFSQSKEFIDKVGGAGLDAGRFIDALYLNILDRAGDAAGRQFWIDSIAKGTPREEVLLALSDSGENKSLLQHAITDGIWYF